MDQITQKCSQSWQAFTNQWPINATLTSLSGLQNYLGMRSQAPSQEQVEENVTSKQTQAVQAPLSDILKDCLESCLCYKNQYEHNPLLALIKIRDLAKTMAAEKVLDSNGIQKVLEEAKPLYKAGFSIVPLNIDILLITPKALNDIECHRQRLEALTQTIRIRPLFANYYLNKYFKQYTELPEGLKAYLQKNPYLYAHYLEINKMGCAEVIFGGQSGRLREEISLEATPVYTFIKTCEQAMTYCYANKPSEVGAAPKRYFLPEEYCYLPQGSNLKNVVPVYPFKHLEKQDPLLAAWWYKTAGDYFQEYASLQEKDEALLEKAAACYGKIQELLDQVDQAVIKDPEWELKKVRVLEGLAYEYLLQGKREEALEILEKADAMILNNIKESNIIKAMDAFLMIEKARPEPVADVAPSLWRRSICMVMKPFAKNSET